MNKKLITFSFVLNIFLGACVAVFGEIDDSPGGVLLGLTVVIIGVVGLISLMRDGNPPDFLSGRD